MPDTPNQAIPAMPSVKPMLTSPWGLFKQAADRYAAQFKPFAMLALMSILGSLPAIVIGGVVGFRAAGKTPAVTPALGAALFIAIVLAIFVGVIAMTGMYLRIESPAEERVRDTLRKARPYFWRFIGVCVLSSLVIFGFTLLLIIPGIIFAVYYTFVEYPVLFEGMSPPKALGRSRMLVKGYWWAVVGRGVFIGLLFLIVGIAWGLVGMVFEKGSTGDSIWQVLQNIAFSFLGPLAVIFEYLIYKELKGIKDRQAPAVQ